MKVGKILGMWIEGIEKDIQAYDVIWLKEFSENYGRVLRAAKNQIDEIESKLSRLEARLDREIICPEDLFTEYVSASSITVDDEEIFLPSYSDECLKYLIKTSNTNMSPFRGLYYCWILGDIAYLFINGKSKKAEEKLINLSDELSLDYELQKKHSKSMDSCNDCSGANIALDEKKKLHISQVKQAIRNVIFKVKKSWIIARPYPAKTSTHFYLSGLRFYHYPHIMNANQALDFSKERYYVQATDSGLFKPQEHYGMILESDNPDEAEELIGELPPGSLAIDISQDEATEDDFNNLVYFEKWSKLITQKAYFVVQETLDLLSSGLPHNAKSLFLRTVTKNPARKFYFDTGIFKAAVLAAEGKLPRISYLTTNKSKVSDKMYKASKKILEQFLDGTRKNANHGLEYFLLEDDGWSGRYIDLSKLTLIASKQLSRFTNCIFSIRDKKTKKIAHGFSYYGLYQYCDNLKNAFKGIQVNELIPPAMVIIAGQMSPIAILMSSLPFAEKFIRAATNIKSISASIQFVEQVRREALPITTNNMKRLISTNS